MNAPESNPELDKLILDEGWSIVVSKEGLLKIKAYGELFPYTHPLSVHLKLYKNLTNPERKYFHMKKAHDYLWPDTIWHYWTERRFREHCNGYNYIVHAGAAATAKSMDAAKLALLFWLANPTKRTVIVASTTMGDLQSRIWGYVLTLIRKSKIPLKVHYTKSPNPILTWRGSGGGGGPKNVQDTIHGMFAIPAKKGEGDKAIAGWIGRHPEDALFMVLDEATDMPLSLLNALPNLEAKADKFFLLAIGNSLDIYDLHGTLATPKAGWDSIDPFKDIKWETTQRNGICLLFNAYESPAIHEPDPKIRAACSEFLITQEQLELKEKEMGKESNQFFRFVLGFWKKSGGGDVVIDPDWIKRFGVEEKAEWAGVYPLNMCAGLDPAFTSGGDNCILRLAILGVDTRGKVVLDFKGSKLLFNIPINATINKSADLQITDAVIDILRAHNCPIHHLCIDMSGAGRGLAETIRLRSNSLHPPKKFYSHRNATTAASVKTNDFITISNYELWFSFRSFIENGQIRGLDAETIFQLTHRLVIVDEATKKPKLEGKLKYKQRIGNILKFMGRSPDEADAASYTLQSAIHIHGFNPGAERSLENSFYLEKIRAMQLQEQQESRGRIVERALLVPNFTADITSLCDKKLF